MKKMLLVLLTTASTILAGEILPEKPEELARLLIPTPEEKQARYDYLLEHRLRVPINTNQYPVFIFRNPVVTPDRLSGTWNSSGTVLVRNGKPTWVLSAAHCFTEDGMYYITVITPDLPVSIYGIEKVVRQSGSNDVIFAKVGTPTFIKGIESSMPEIKVSNNSEFSVDDARAYATNQITGETFAILGGVKNEGSPLLFLMDYSSVRGESGAGFLYQDKILVVSQIQVLGDATQRMFRLKPRSGRFTLLVGTQLRWP